MRSFDTAIDRALADADGNEEGWFDFEINERDKDGEIVRVQHCRASKPEDGLVLATMANMGRHSSTTDRMAGVIDLLYGVCDEETQAYLQRRLLDNRDPFGHEEVMGIMEGLVEEWGGRPTKQPSDFKQSQGNTGKRSTRRTST